MISLTLEVNNMSDKPTGGDDHSNRLRHQRHPHDLEGCASAPSGNDREVEGGQPPKFDIPKSSAPQYKLSTSPGNPAARLDDTKDHRAVRRRRKVRPSIWSSRTTMPEALSPIEIAREIGRNYFNAPGSEYRVYEDEGGDGGRARAR